MRRRRSLTVIGAVAALVALPVVPAHADTTTQTYIVQLARGVSADTAVPQLLGPGARVVHKVFQGGIVKLNATAAAALARNPQVKSVTPDSVVHSSATELNAPWDLDMLDSPTATTDSSYTYPNNGGGVTVYVIDSGIQATHSQFSGATIGQGYDFVDNDTNPADCAGHGTAVSSLVVGNTLGAAKGVTLVPLRVLDCSGSGTSSNVILAADWIASNRAPGAPAVANLSLGGPSSGGTSSLDTALQGLINSGVDVVVAAGNSGADACTDDPAALPDAITVAAVDQNHVEPSWSNYGSCVDLYAPGVSDVVAVMDSTSTSIGLESGTSFSAPLTSATVALILHDHPSWSPAQVRSELMTQALNGLVTGQKGSPTSPNVLLHTTGMFVGPAPTISGAPYVGETLRASQSWSPTPGTLTYQWNSNGVAIPNATTSTYVVTSSDVGQSVTVTVSGSSPGYETVTGTSAAVVPSARPDPGTVVTMTPSRLLDTRFGPGPIGRVSGGQTLKLAVAGVGNVMASVSAVLVNITATDVTSDGYVTAYASGGTMPATSNANFTYGSTSANLALVPVGSDGAISLTVMGGSVQLIVDIQSYVVGGTVTYAGAVVPVAPQRLLDTRQSSPLGAGSSLDVQVTGRGPVPAGATAVFLNVTVTHPQSTGYLTVFPKGDPTPATSNLNFVPNLTAPNMVLAKVGADGSVSILNGSPGSADVIVDVMGYLTAGTPVASGTVVPISPSRVVDTRIGLGAQGPVAPSSGVVVTMTGGQVPSGAHGVFMNLTVTDPRAGGWVAAYPTQSSLPLVSNLNFVAAQTVPNLATVGLAGGQATLYNGSTGTVQLVTDIFGYIL
ncbi:MAG TPA: S8 family peptidase [Propionibacteriaceae bacterium]|nr:S8 family peptidase [Propionibacteriaceae bacterium]